MCEVQLLLNLLHGCVNVNINAVRCMVKQTYMQFLAERSLCTNLCAAKYCMPTATSRHIPMSTGSDSPYDNREQVCVGLKTTQARTSNYAVPYRSRAMYCWTASLNYSLTHSPCSYCTCAQASIVTQDQSMH